MNTPKFDNVRLIMSEMFGEHTTRNWTTDELVYHVRTVTLEQLADYPQFAKPLMDWLNGL